MRQLTLGDHSLYSRYLYVSPYTERPEIHGEIRLSNKGRAVSGTHPPTPRALFQTPATQVMEKLDADHYRGLERLT